MQYFQQRLQARQFLFFTLSKQRIVHCSIVRCNNKQADNSQITYFNLPKDPQRRLSWFAAINKDKGNLSSNAFVCSDYFEGKYHDNKSWNLQNRLFCTDRPIKTKMISTAISTLLSLKQISAPRKTYEIT